VIRRTPLSLSIALSLQGLLLPIAASAQQTIDAVADDGTMQELGVIEVRAQRESQERAIDRKHDSDAITDVVSADSMGQYPDKNVAESLQRLPGISITRDQGEGRFVVVRGLDAALNSVSVDGIAIGTPEDSVRSATLDVIPSDSTERLTVVKAPTPDMPGDSIGGAIRIESASGFDRDGRSIRGKLEGGYSQLSGDWSPKATFNYSDRFGDTFAVAFGINYQDRDYQSDNVEAEYDYNDDLGEDVMLAEQVQWRKYFVNRKRFGTNLNFDWRPDDDNRYWLRTLYSDFEDAETRQRSVFSFGDGTLAGIEGGNLLIDELPADALGRRVRWRTKEQSTLAFNLGGENRLSGATIDYRVGYTDTRERVLDEVEARFEYDGDDLAARIDQGHGIPRFDIIDPSGDGWLRNENYVLDRFIPAPIRVDDDELSAAFNVSFEAGNATWKTGLLGRWRDRASDIDERELRDVPDLLLSEWSTTAPEHRFGDLGPGIDSGAMRDWYREHLGEIGERPQDVAENAAISAAEDYTASEDIVAGYFMGTWDIDALRVIAGVRVERTDFSAVGSDIQVNEDGDFVLPIGTRRADNRYTNVLPGLHLRYDTGNDWVLRAAWTNTVSRPSFGDASPRMTVNREDEEIDAGNPDLDPYESSNLDLAAEWYFGDNALFAAGLFHKRIDGYIVETTTRDSADHPDYRVTRPVNGDRATVTGLELNWQQQFESGLLLGASATFLDTEFELPSRPGEMFALPRASDRVYSAFIGYEKGGLSARLAAVHRGDYLDEIGDERAFDIHVASNTQLDFTIDYGVGDQWTVYLEASNLLDEPLRLYQGSPEYVLQNEEYGRTWAVGLKFRL